MRSPWPEAAIDGVCLGLFMVSACVFGTWVFHPASALHVALGSDLPRRVVMGAIMGATAIALIYSPLGRRSGAHMNPATTLTFLALGKISVSQASTYVIAQFIGGTAGVYVSSLLLGPWLADPAVSYVTTVPGSAGIVAAFGAESAMTFVLMSAVLFMTSNHRLSSWTGVAAGGLVWFFITVEAPISGMSMNPARTFASAMVAQTWSAIWLYFVAPLLGMLAAAAVHRTRGRSASGCAKYMHTGPCHFCEYRTQRTTTLAKTRIEH